MVVKTAVVWVLLLPVVLFLSARSILCALQFMVVILTPTHLILSADTIFVRAYESRMDLLRAVIVGAEGTPYHDGLFFFDVFFPSGYPTSPPVCD